MMDPLRHPHTPAPSPTTQCTYIQDLCCEWLRHCGFARVGNQLLPVPLAFLVEDLVGGLLAEAQFAVSLWLTPLLSELSLLSERDLKESSSKSRPVLSNKIIIHATIMSHFRYLNFSSNYTLKSKKKQVK